MCYFPTVMTALMGYCPQLLEQEPYIFAINMLEKVEQAQEYLGDSEKVS